MCIKTGHLSKKANLALSYCYICYFIWYVCYHCGTCINVLGTAWSALRLCDIHTYIERIYPHTNTLIHNKSLGMTLIISLAEQNISQSQNIDILKYFCNAYSTKMDCITDNKGRILYLTQRRLYSNRNYTEQKVKAIYHIYNYTLHMKRKLLCTYNV